MRQIGIFSDLSTRRSGGSKSNNSYHMNTFGQSMGRGGNGIGRGMGGNAGAIQLDASDADSDQGIITDRWASKPSLSAA